MTLHNIHTHYKLSGEDVVFFWAVELNFLRNFVISRFPMVLTTEGGAQPPGFTVRGGGGRGKEGERGVREEARREKEGERGGGGEREGERGGGGERG